MIGKIKKEAVLDAYKNSCQLMVNLFCEKQEIEFDGWAGNDIGGTAGFSSQHFFNISDIVTDIENDCEKGLILQWQDDCLEYSPESINYKAYSMGLRFSDLKPTLKPLPEFCINRTGDANFECFEKGKCKQCLH